MTTNKRIIRVTPTKKQYKALMILLQDNGISFIGYGGSAGGGKTILASMWISAMCSKYPGVVYGVFRRYLTDSLDTTFKSFLKALSILGLREAPTEDQLFKNPNFDFVIKNGGKEIIFSNGSQIWFRGLQEKPTDIHFTKIGGLELTGAYIDEANECPEYGIDVLKKRVGRHKNIEYNIPRKVLCTFNPDKGWVYRRFRQGFKLNKYEEGAIFIQALPIDNPYLSKEYINELKNEKNERLRQRLYYGNFDYDDTPGRLFEYEALIDLITNASLNGEKYMSCDVARKGKDTAVIMVWDGLEVIDYKEFSTCTITELRDTIKQLQQKHIVGVSNIIVDEDGVGGGLVDMLKCRGFINNSRAFTPITINKFTAFLTPNYNSLKDQCYFKLGELVNSRQIKVSIDNREVIDKIIEELDIIVETGLDTDGKKRIIKKDDIKEKLGRSPDYADCLMMRMFFELYKNEQSQIQGETEAINDPIWQMINEFDNKQNEDLLDLTIY